jgi:hypothetical protein
MQLQEKVLKRMEGGGSARVDGPRARAMRCSVTSKLLPLCLETSTILAFLLLLLVDEKGRQEFKTSAESVLRNSLS